LPVALLGVPSAPSSPSSPDRQDAPETSSLDPEETSADRLCGLLLEDYDPPREDFRVTPISLAESVFRHSGWRVARRAVFDTIKAVQPTGNRVDAFANCGSAAFVQVNEDGGELRISANYCHDRLCLKCGQARARIIANATTTHCEGKLVRFATLTLRHSQTPLKDQLDRLRVCFNRLRERQFWREHVTGGIAFVEIKWLPATRMWHPHLHLLVETKWLPQAELSTNWHAVTGDSFIVDVRPIKSAEEATRYVCKYASKPMESSVYKDPAALTELALAVKGSRLYSKFGTWHGVELEPDPAVEQRWISLGRLADLLHDARSGDADAQRLLEAVKRQRDVKEGRAPP
jgi:hypothetical protein